MKLFLRFAILCGLFLVLAIVMGCSDDKSTGPSDAEIEAMMRAEVAQDMSAIISSLSYGYEQFGGFSEPGTDDVFGKPVVPQDSSHYEYTNGWHYFYMEEDSSLDYGAMVIDYSASLADSVQFRNGQTIVQEPDESTDKLYFKFWLEMFLEMTSGDTSFSIDINTYHVDAIYEVQAGGVLVNGDLDLDYNISASQGSDFAQGNIDYTCDVNDLLLSDPDGCPVSGSISATMIVDLQGSAGAADGTWTMTVTFTGSNNVHVQLSGAGFDFDYTDTFDCGGYAAVPIPVNLLLNRFR